MHANWKTWTHVTKLDPDKRLPGGAIEEIATSGTDALMLSGTQNVTRDNLLELLDQVSPYGLPVVVEPASPDCAIFDGGIDHLFVPSVLNTNDVRWIVGKHYTWLLNNGDGINWDMVVPEAYIVLNPDSAVGRVTGADCNLSAMEVAAFAQVADRYFRFPIVYIEYSGRYGDPQIVRAAAGAIKDALLYYGGGIRSAEQAAEMGRYADTIVVGNAVYEEGIEVLRATVRAVH
ncbi:MAG TPA: phosphoglycerol geranylgeranyltransferase [Methanoculleus sp.]|jgi:phosphoglycerol geranylgeranyltransferase|nr:phosphoglycerol geranylgeranyltransferase [Methanoculleus sp.]MBP8675441.1 phosphoglycerol geranylgeranyltransferase [Methanoculleus sp.]HOB06457.1 phosphoglycerol geranylgeranyltransferase [Methanoculleus sp.]HOD85114.1 phosphoglycerol geranylgeranyltransferase [Methanoculleus sp.]HON40037.1 phosphoglycerol geranylgeranyltransferase [Methanoculleus sp.]